MTYTMRCSTPSSSMGTGSQKQKLRKPTSCEGLVAAARVTVCAERSELGFRVMVGLR